MFFYRISHSICLHTRRSVCHTEGHEARAPRRPSTLASARYGTNNHHDQSSNRNRPTPPKHIMAQHQWYTEIRRTPNHQGRNYQKLIARSLRAIRLPVSLEVYNNGWTFISDSKNESSLPDFIHWNRSTQQVGLCWESFFDEGSWCQSKSRNQVTAYSLVYWQVFTVADSFLSKYVVFKY